MQFETRAIHAGGEPDDETGAIAPPIHMSTTFERGVEGDAPRGYTYVRDGNPTQTRLEAALAAIDSAEVALAFSSGMAASTAALQSLPPGSHVILPAVGYYGVRVLARDFLPHWGIEHSLVDVDDLEAVRRAIRPETKLVWCESPSNPLMQIVDLAAIASLAHEAGAMLIVDGTFATPALQRPLELGADVVLHSTTKYIGGHSDVQGGSLAFRSAGIPLAERAAHVREITGGVASPFNAWLILRGIRSLAARMRVHCENARRLAGFLSTHPRVEIVHYPGLPSHPLHEVARRQMTDFGGMMSIRVRGGREEALRVAASTKIFRRATSLGGTESLIEHRASSEGPGSITPQNLLRLSVGLENAEDLVEDMGQALE